jgi:protein-disulfide isomerase/uncharacterized membrane protein
MRRIVLLIILAAAAAGVFISSDLTYVHYKTHTDQGYQSFCAISDAWNCQTVATSEYSVFWKLPVSLWGLLVYLLCIHLVVVALVDLMKGRKEGTRGMGSLAVLAAGGVAVAALLYYVSVAVIHSKCILCFGLYAVNAVTAASVAVYAVAGRENPLRWIAADLRGILLKPGYPLAGFGAAAAAAAALLVFYPRLYINDINCSPGKVDTSSPTCNEEATYGSSNPELVITEFSDYECPYCGMTHFALRKVVDAYPGRIVLKHRHFPLDMSCNPLLTRPFHRKSCLAAKAAVCAGKQNRFWEMSDWLYKNRKKLSKETILEAAGELKLDTVKLEACMKDPATLQRIQSDIHEAAKTTFVRSGMIGTPIIYIGDRPHIGGMSTQEITGEVDALLSAH